MKLKSFFLLLLAAVLTVSAPRSARAEDLSFEFFYDSLSPYGEWLEVGDYGLCWKPSDVDEDWAPYADGYWTYTDGGWTWVSYEDFGGITYHYGRWVKVEDEGWVWVPDYEWAPAWVSWRNNDENIGWAPLPPEAHWQKDRGFSSWVDVSYDIAPVCYNFVRVTDFGAPYLRPLLRHRRENVVIVENSVNITNISFNNDADCIFNGGPDFVRVNRFATRPIPTLKLVRNTNITVVNNTIINNNVRIKNVNAVQQGNQLAFIAPRLARPGNDRINAFVKPNARRVIPQARVTKGWAAMPQEQQLAVRKKMKQETRDLTPETAPARPVKVADLQMLPVKADPDAVIPGGNRQGRQRPGLAEDPRAKTPVVPTPIDPNAVAKPADPREVARAAREKALQDKRDAAEAAKVAKEQKPTPTIPGVDEKPNDPRTAARNAREAALLKKQQDAAAKAAEATAANPNDPVARGGKRGKPGAPVQPFNPADPATTTGQTTVQPTTPDVSEQQALQERRRAAEGARTEAAKQKAADQQQAREAAQQRASELKATRQQQLQQQQEKAARTPVSADPKPDAPDPQILQQRRAEQAAKQQEAAQQRAAQAEALRQRAAEGQQAARERAAGANEARQRALQQQQAASAARAQSADQAEAVAARQQGLQRQQAQAAAREQAAGRSEALAARQQALQQQQQAQAAARQQAVVRQQGVQPPAQRQVAPVQRGGIKKKLTPEEAAAAKDQQ